MLYNLITKKGRAIMKYTELDRKNDFQWFLDNYDLLYQKYGVSYISIQNQKILGVYNDFGEAVDKTSESKILGSFIVQFCNGLESGYTNYIASDQIGVV